MELDIRWVNHAVDEARSMVKHGNGEIEIEIRKVHMLSTWSGGQLTRPRVVFPTLLTQADSGAGVKPAERMALARSVVDIDIPLRSRAVIAEDCDPGVIRPMAAPRPRPPHDSLPMPALLVHHCCLLPASESGILALRVFCRGAGRPKLHRTPDRTAFVVSYYCVVKYHGERKISLAFKSSTVTYSCGLSKLIRMSFRRLLGFDDRNLQTFKTASTHALSRQNQNTTNPVPHSALSRVTFPSFSFSSSAFCSPGTTSPPRSQTTRPHSAKVDLRKKPSGKTAGPGCPPGSRTTPRPNRRPFNSCHRVRVTPSASMMAHGRRPAHPRREYAPAPQTPAQVHTRMQTPVPLASSPCIPPLARIARCHTLTRGHVLGASSMQIARKCAPTSHDLSGSVHAACVLCVPTPRIHSTEAPDLRVRMEAGLKR
ncbi:hypothetical protein C8R44DRAFT_753337 [Mycena epipterygia]|nr:hypothetical protein C8R44DRAFT_753337 [Mycena epipterygia]